MGGRRNPARVAHRRGGNPSPPCASPYGLNASSLMRVRDKLPVTVSITRHLDPDQSDQMLAWVRAGSQLAERFDGFLGSGWVRPARESDEWHMLYRFADAASLESWQVSEQRRWWLGSAQGMVGESKICLLYTSPSPRDRTR